MIPQNNPEPDNQLSKEDEILANAANAAKSFVEESPKSSKDNSPNSQSAAQVPVSQPEPVNRTPQAVPSQAIQPIHNSPVFASFDTQGLQAKNNAISDQRLQDPVSYSQMSKKKNFLLIPLILLLILLLLGGTAVGLYLGYWTTSDTVYSRFQKNLATIANESVKANTDTITSYAYDLKVAANQNSENILEVDSSGRTNESGFDSLSDISYRGSDINVAGRFLLQDDASPYTLYIKLKGISRFLNTSGLNESLGADTTSILSEYDDQWVSIDLLDSFTGSTDEKAETLTKENYKELWEAIEPTVRQKIIGTNKDSGVFRISNERTEKVAGLNAWAYDITFDEGAHNDALDSLIQDVESTSSLSNTQKSEIKKSLESSKIKDDGYASSYDKTESTTIWIEKNTAKIVRIRKTNEEKYDGEVILRSSTEVSVTKFSLAAIDLEMKFTTSYGDDNTTEITSRIKFDNTAKTVSIDGNYGTKDDGYTFTLNFKPDTSNDAITKPEQSVDYKTISKRLGLD